METNIRTTIEQDTTIMTDKKDGAGEEVAFAVAEPVASGYTGIAFKEFKDSKVGIAFRQEKPDDPITISKNDGLFANTDIKVGMQVESVNGVTIDGYTRIKAISFIKEAEGQVTVVGKAVKGGAVATVFKESPDQKCGITLKQDAPTDYVTVSKIGDDGLFAKTDLKPGMQVMSINNIPVEDIGKMQAIQIIKGAEGKVVVVGAPLSAKSKAVASASNGVVPPPGVAAGGTWGTNKYVGSNTQLYACVGCLCFGLPGLCICLCPQDERDAYRLGNVIYDADGRRIGTAPSDSFIPKRQQMQR